SPGSMTCGTLKSVSSEPALRMSARVMPAPCSRPWISATRSGRAMRLFGVVAVMDTYALSRGIDTIWQRGCHVRIHEQVCYSVVYVNLLGMHVDSELNGNVDRLTRVADRKWKALRAAMLCASHRDP